jgi:uncharacterized protein YyaL (SSP411 family)
MKRTIYPRNIRLFHDDELGGFFDTGSDAEEVLFRTKSSYDDVIPSGNSVAAMNLIKLGKILRDDSLIREGERTLQAFTGKIEQQPYGYPNMLNALDFFHGRMWKLPLPVGKKMMSVPPCFNSSAKSLFLTWYCGLWREMRKKPNSSL